jgi:hypothetical protein
MRRALNPMTAGSASAAGRHHMTGRWASMAPASNTNGKYILYQYFRECSSQGYIEDIWPDYPTKDDFFFNEEEY